MVRTLLLSVTILGLMPAGCRKADSSSSAPPTPGQVEGPKVKPGIDEPLAIKGIKLKLKSLVRTSVYRIADVQTMRPTSPDQEFAVVSGEASGDQVEAGLDDWKAAVFVKDEKDGKHTPELTMKGTHPKKPGIVDITWVVVVPKASRSLTLHLPEGNSIVLDSLMEKK